MPGILATSDCPEGPGVTIVIPAYNYVRFVAQAVRSALAQTWAGEVEVLVVDDGSTDETPAVVASFGAKIRYHRKENEGLSAARNTGMLMARHDWVVFLDADDELEPDAVGTLVEARNAAESPPVVVGSLGRMTDAEGAWLTGPPASCDGSVKVFAAVDFVLRNRFAPIVLADRRVLLSLGGFDPNLKASEDRDMWIRAATAGPVLMVSRALHRKRDHGTNMSRQATRQTQSILQVLAKARANASVNLSRRLAGEAEAICLYQSARMHLAAGDRWQALKQCCRSVGRCFWLYEAASTGFPPAFRARFLILGGARLFGLTRPSPPRSGGPASNVEKPSPRHSISP